MTPISPVVGTLHWSLQVRPTRPEHLASELLRSPGASAKSLTPAVEAEVSLTLGVYGFWGLGATGLNIFQSGESKTFKWHGNREEYARAEQVQMEAYCTEGIQKIKRNTLEALKILWLRFRALRFWAILGWDKGFRDEGVVYPNTSPQNNTVLTMGTPQKAPRPVGNQAPIPTYYISLALHSPYKPP